MFTYAFILTTMYFLNWTTVSERLCPVGNKIVARERALYKFYYYYYYCDITYIHPYKETARV